MALMLQGSSFKTLRWAYSLDNRFVSGPARKTNQAPLKRLSDSFLASLCKFLSEILHRPLGLVLRSLAESGSADSCVPANNGCGSEGNFQWNLISTRSPITFVCFDRTEDLIARPYLPHEYHEGLILYSFLRLRAASRRS